MTLLNYSSASVERVPCICQRKSEHSVIFLRLQIPHWAWSIFWAIWSCYNIYLMIIYICKWNVILNTCKYFRFRFVLSVWFYIFWIYQNKTLVDISGHETSLVSISDLVSSRFFGIVSTINVKVKPIGYTNKYQTYDHGTHTYSLLNKAVIKCSWLSIS